MFPGPRLLTLGLDFLNIIEMNLNLFLPLCILLLNTVTAQSYYSKNIDFEGQTDSGNTIHQIENGFLITGTSFCFDTLVECFSIITTDELGEVTNFEKISNFPFWASAGVFTGNGGVVLKNADEYFISGAIQVGSPQWDVFLIKTNGEGDTLWMKTYGSPIFDESTSAMVLSQDTTLVLLNAYALNPYKLLVWLLKVDLDGNIIWEKYLGQNYKNAGYQDLIKL
jgi:hypothetical protein